MQLPTAQTSVARCQELALYTTTMLSKFPDNAVLTVLGAKLAIATQVLTCAQQAYAETVRAVVTARVALRYADHTADIGVRRALRAAEAFDGAPAGPIATRLFPAGVTPIVKPIGVSEITELRDLEARFDQVMMTWPQAAEEKANVIELRNQYEAAIEMRRAAKQRASELAAARDVAREDFLDVYEEVAGRIQAEFPRDRLMQDLFFEKDRAPAMEASEGDEEVPSTSLVPERTNR